MAKTPKKTQEPSALAGEEALEAPEAEAPVAAPPPKRQEAPMMVVNCPWPIRVNGTEYYGQVRVTHDLAEVLIEMTARKRQAELAPLVGREMQVKRLLDGQVAFIDSQAKERI